MVFGVINDDLNFDDEKRNQIETLVTDYGGNSNIERIRKRSCFKCSPSRFAEKI